MSNEQEKTVCEPTFLETIKRIDNIIETQVKRIDEKIQDKDTKYQIQFTAAKEAVAIASTAQKELVAQALGGTKEAITKNDTNTDKRFDLLSEKIDGVMEAMNKNTGERGIYVTHEYLNISLDKLQSNIEAALKPLIAYMNASEGRGGGAKDMYGWIIGGISFLIMVASFIIKF